MVDDEESKALKRAKRAAYMREWSKRPQNVEKVLATARAKHARNREALNQRARERYQANKEPYRQRERKWKEANPGRAKEIGRKWRQENREQDRRNHADWALRNPEAMRAIKAKRRAAKLKATPAWANRFFIAEAYRLAALRERVTGFKWHVDHIVPLVSPVVCGLHVENNLKVIPAIVNLRKSNSHFI